MIEISREQFLELLKKMGAHSWWVYSAMMALAEDGECRITQEELAEKLGVSKSTLRRYVSALNSVCINWNRLVTTSKEQDSNVYRLLELKVVGESQGSKDAIQRQKTATEEVWEYWQLKYKERYGTKYRPSNWAKDKGCLKRLVERYEGNTELIKRIIDVVMRLYDSHWKSKHFTRPTIGQLVSWLASQAEPYALKAAEQEPEVETADSHDEIDLLDLIDRKWGE